LWFRFVIWHSSYNFGDLTSTVVRKASTEAMVGSEWSATFSQSGLLGIRGLHLFIKVAFDFPL